MALLSPLIISKYMEGFIHLKNIGKLKMLAHLSPCIFSLSWVVFGSNPVTYSRILCKSLLMTEVVISLLKKVILPRLIWPLIVKGGNFPVLQTLMVSNQNASKCRNGVSFLHRAVCVCVCLCNCGSSCFKCSNELSLLSKKCIYLR